MADDPVRVQNASASLRKALQDLRRIDRCLADEPPDAEDALFHCQQAAEKSLKAFLTWHDQPFRKTHDLASLGNQCKQIDRSLDVLLDRLDDVTQYAWAYRYPTQMMEPPETEVDEASELARTIVAEVVSRLPAAVRDAASRRAIQPSADRSGNSEEPGPGGGPPDR